MRLKFTEPRLLLLLKLGVFPVVQSLRPFKERPLRFNGIRCASDIERIPGPWPFFWAPTRRVVSYSACQLVEGEVLLWSRSCGELLELEVEQRLLDVLSNFIDLARHSGFMSKLPFQRRRQRHQKRRRLGCLDELVHALQSEVYAEADQGHDGLPPLR